MAYVELEQFLGRGEEKALWIFSYKHALGFLVGGFLGRAGASLLFGSPGWAFLGMLLGVIVGVALMTQYHGILVARRLFLLGRFYVRRSRGPQRITAALLYECPGVQPPRMRIRHRDGRPIAIPRQRLVPAPEQPYEEQPA